jgi:hypothetical protein
VLVPCAPSSRYSKKRASWRSWPRAALFRPDFAPLVTTPAQVAIPYVLIVRMRTGTSEQLIRHSTDDFRTQKESSCHDTSAASTRNMTARRTMRVVRQENSTQGRAGKKTGNTCDSPPTGPMVLLWSVAADVRHHVEEALAKRLAQSAPPCLLHDEIQKTREFPARAMSLLF